MAHRQLRRPHRQHSHASNARQTCLLRSLVVTVIADIFLPVIGLSWMLVFVGASYVTFALRLDKRFCSATDESLTKPILAVPELLQQPTVKPTSKPRAHYLDHLKVVLTAIVVLHHTTCAFMGGGWMYEVGPCTHKWSHS